MFKSNRCHRLRLSRFADPDRNRALVTVDAFFVVFYHGAEALEDERAELIGRGFGQPLRFVHAPMLHRKIGRGKYQACLIFDLPRQPVRCDRNRHARLIAGDPTAAQSLSYSGGSAAAEKKIGHDSIFRRATRNDSLKQLLRFLSG